MDDIKQHFETHSGQDLFTETFKAELKALAAKRPLDLGPFLNNPIVRHGLIELVGRGRQEAVGLDFFAEAYILSLKRLVQCETSEDFLIRKRELSRELKAAFLYFVEIDWQINLENYNSLMTRGDRLCADSLYTDAFQCFSKATFLAEILIPSGELSMPKLSEEANRKFGSKILSYDARKKQVDCLFKDNQFRKASIYANYLFNSIAHNEIPESREFYPALRPLSYVSVMEQMINSEIKLNRPYRSVELCRMPLEIFCGMEKGNNHSRAFQETRKLGFEGMFDFYECKKINTEDVQKFKSSARIVVNEGVPQKFSNGQFIVPSIDVAVKIAKENDIIFLEPGVYRGYTLKKNKIVLEICKSLTIIGAGPRSIIIGSIIKWGSGKLRFQNLSLYVGKDKKDCDEIYLMDGLTEFLQCSIFSRLNTAVYIVGNKNDTAASFDLCILDGCDNCVRFFSLEGHSSSLGLSQCIISSMYSLISVVNVEENVNLTVIIAHCFAMDIQEFLKLIVAPSSVATCNITFTEVELNLFDHGATSSVATISNGTLFVRNCQIFGNHTDFIAFDVKKTTTEMHNITIKAVEENRRQFSIGQGIKMLDVQKAFLNCVKVYGLKVGFQISNSLDMGRATKNSACKLESCNAEECSVGILVKQQDDTCQHSNGTKFYLSVLSSILYKNYYGIMIENAKTSVHVEDTDFQLTPFPVLAHLSSVNLLRLEDCTPELRKLREEQHYETAYRKHIDDLYERFVQEENIPRRVEYDPDEYTVYTDFCPP